MAKMLLASPVIEKEKADLQKRCAALRQRNVIPSMKVILVGNNPASVIYTRNKKKFCESFGAECEIIYLPEDISEQAFIATVAQHAANPLVHGLFVQLPLPHHLSHLDVARMVPPRKDVDGFHPENIGHLFLGNVGGKGLLPCTPKGIMTLLHHYNMAVESKEVVIIGRSAIVGRPLALLMMNYNATITVCHSRTKNLQAFAQRADILVSAIGRAKFIDSSFFSATKRPVVVDVGINYDEYGKLCGDVDLEKVDHLVEAITPVPGGVGPMTILSLAQNLLQATENGLYE